MTRIGEQIRRARETAGFVGAEGRRRVANRTGYTDGYLAQIEREGQPSEVIAKRLARLYGCTLNVFYIRS